MEEGDWCMKPMKQEDMNSVVRWRTESETWVGIRNWK